MDAAKLSERARRGRALPAADAARRDVLLESARLLRACADDVRHVLDLGPRVSPLRDPLAR